MKKTNILLITSDQQRWDTIGAANGKIKTPNLDRLAREGILFSRSYTVNPVCTPTRCTLLTGQYPSRHGCNTIGTNLPEDYPTIPELFNSEGYRTGLFGKAHFQSCLDPGSFEAAPRIFDDSCFAEWDGPYYGFQKARLVIGHTEENHSRGMHYGQWLKENGVDTDRYFGHAPYENYGVWDLPEEYHPSRWVADETIRALDETDKEDDNFFYWSSFQDPHNPCVVPEPWASMYDPGDMPDYGFREGEMEGKPPFYKSLVESASLGLDLGEKPWYCIKDSHSLGLDEKECRKITALYYGMISLMDHHIGRILDKLEEKDMLDNTLIIFTSDHGDYLGNHGLWWKGLPAYEDAQKVPFIVRHPRCETQGEESSALQSLVDVGTTILSAAGIPVPPGLQGVDQTPSWTDASRSCRDWAQVEFRPSESDYMQKTHITDEYKLVLYHREEYGELYHLKTDPDQRENLWDRPDYSGIKNRLLRHFISAEMEKDGKLRTRTAPA